MPNQENRDIIEINQALNALGVTGSLQDKWWNTPNNAFNHKTPYEVIKTESGADKIKDYLLKYLG